MAEPTQTKPAPAPASKAAAPKTIKVFPVYSPMHDPHTGVTYGETGVEVLALDPWVKCQVDAGKLRVE